MRIRVAVAHRFLPALAALLAVSCASLGPGLTADFDAAPLFGMVYDGANQPCEGVRIEVDGAEGPRSDLRGRFVISGLPRGDHRFVARKDGFEDLSVAVSFLARTDVLHLRLTSFEQLLGMAQAALRDARLADADGLLARAGKLEADDPVLRYLLAILAWKERDNALAAARLEALLADRGPQPAVLLFLAGIYERDLDDPAKAAARLEAYLALRADPDVERRLAALVNRLSAP
jgi:hypothetical protein